MMGPWEGGACGTGVSANTAAEATGSDWTPFGWADESESLSLPCWGLGMLGEELRLSWSISLVSLLPSSWALRLSDELSSSTSASPSDREPCGSWRNKPTNQDHVEPTSGPQIWYYIIEIVHKIGSLGSSFKDIFIQTISDTISWNTFLISFPSSHLRLLPFRCNFFRLLSRRLSYTFCCLWWRYLLFYFLWIQHDIYTAELIIDGRPWWWWLTQVRTDWKDNETQVRVC